MKILYTQADGSKLVFDKKEGDQVIGHIVSPNGTEFSPRPIEQILARGYWEAVDDSKF
jgi:hypothetical protein